MTNATLKVPADHAWVLREAIKGEMCADGNEFPSIDPDRKTVDEVIGKLEAHRIALRRLGWGADAVAVDLDGGKQYLAAIVESAMCTCSSCIAELVGEYRKDGAAIDLEAVRVHGEAMLWLTDALESLNREAVTV